MEKELRRSVQSGSYVDGITTGYHQSLNLVDFLVDFLVAFPGHPSFFSPTDVRILVPGASI